MKEKLQGTCIILTMWVIPFIQSLAITFGIMEGFGWFWLFAGFAGFALGCIPILGSLLAIWGAIIGWGWHWSFASIFLIEIALLYTWFQIIRKDQEN